MGSPTTMSLPSMPAAALFRMNRREALDNQRLAAGVGPIPWRGVHSDVHLSATWRDIEGGRAEHRVPSARFSDRHWITTRPPASFAEREKNRKLRSERPADACDGGESSAYRMAVERALLACLPGVPLWLICSSRSSRELIWNSGARPAVPRRSTTTGNMVERLWARLTRSGVQSLSLRKDCLLFLGRALLGRQH